MSWSYRGGDSGITLFTACLNAGAPIEFRPGMKVLEIGSCESDWIERAALAWPEVEFVGVDVRTGPSKQRGRYTLVKGDAMNNRLFEEQSFDAIVSLSAIEHVGLGHYGDPKDPDGDTKAVANAWRWLKPGGFFYFDVPYDPTKYWVQGTKCRMYDDDAILMRLIERGWSADTWEGYVGADTPGTLVDKPTEPHKRYWYVASVWRKA